MDLLQALSILNPTEKSDKGLKDAYKNASLKHHPDRGGDLEIMKLVNAAYDYLKKCDSWWTGEQARKAKKMTPLTETMEKLILELQTIKGIKIEIIGSWLWVSGETFPCRAFLKKLGFRFSRGKSSWYYHEEKFRKRSKKKFSLPEIRQMHGAEDVDKNDPLYIAA